MHAVRTANCSLPDTVRAAIEPLVSKGDHFLLAVSGGADSTALLCAMAALYSDTPACLSCLHVDHGLRSREEARREESFVRDLCASFSIPLSVVHVPAGSLAEQGAETGDSLEALARDVRHRALARRREELSAQLASSIHVWIVLPHTLNDVHEGLLLRGLRGSGPDGLVPLPLCDEPILRPLVGTTRDTIESWLVGQGQPWCEDPSNKDLSFLRNRIRHRLIPLLDTDFPFWRGGIEAFGETQALVAHDIAKSLEKTPFWEVQADGQALSADLSVFMGHSPLLREVVIFKGVDMLMALSRNRGAGAREDEILMLPGEKPSSPDRLADPLPRVPRRAVVRRVALAPLGTWDLGPCILRCDGGQLRMESRDPIRRTAHVTISAPGRYFMTVFVLEIAPHDGADTVSVSVDLPLVLDLDAGPDNGKFRAVWRDVRGREGAFARKDGKFTVHLSSERVHSKGMYCCLLSPVLPLPAEDGTI